jgi:23S rRNA (cytosine1962-C5)-methyltransferase
MTLNDLTTNVTTKPALAIPSPQPWHKDLEKFMRGKTVLSVFSGDCALGIFAAQSGALFVVNVDHDAFAIATAKDMIRQANLPIRPRLVVSDAFAAMRQLAGLGQNERVRGKRMPSFPKLEARQFDLVVIEPPLHSKSPFGVVDLLADYASVFKPALLCTGAGGTLVCSNQVAGLDRSAWVAQLERTATKAGRPIKSVEWPSSENDPDQSVVILHLA